MILKNVFNLFNILKIIFSNIIKKNMENFVILLEKIVEEGELVKLVLKQVSSNT